MSQISVLFDTETTGLDPLAGDRIIEIAAIELLRDLPTGRFFHAVIDPERDVPEEATRIHGFTRGDLIGKPKFADIADDFLAFVGDCKLIAHNAGFDFGFVNAELARLSLPPLHPSRMIDTLALAKTRFPGLPNSLNALCTRFAIDLSERTTHNALLDCRLLAEVYVELTGGRQRGLVLQAAGHAGPVVSYAGPVSRTPVLVTPTAAQLAAHAQFLSRIKDPVWATLPPPEPRPAG
jgi:DNA polymerase-3 subunit epsilon